MQGQDWDTVVLSKPKSVSNIQTNKQPIKLTDEQIRLNKLENGESTIKKVNTELRIKIQQARNAKKMSQAVLAQKVNVTQKTINELESGRGEKNNALLGKLEKVLSVKLRGKSN